MNKEKFCPKRSDKLCTELYVDCYRPNEKECEYSKTYLKHFKNFDDNPPELARRVRVNMFPKFRENWIKRAQKTQTIANNVLSTHLEKEITNILNEQLGSLSVEKIKKEIYPVHEGCKISADAIAKKKGHPTCIFSIKTWIGLEQIRETFAYAYLAKNYYELKNIKVYEIGFIKLPKIKTDTVKILADAYKPYLDGVFYLTEPPYIDDLITELKKMYSKPK